MAATVPSATDVTDAICAQALRPQLRGAEAEAELVTMAGVDREALEAARDRMVTRLHRRPDDWDATGALTLLNRALARYGWVERYDWKVRWAQHRKP